MMNIREYKTKIIGGKTYIGVEIENKDENYYSNKIKVEFLKKGALSKEEIILIPLISGDCISFVGETYDFTDYDDVKLTLEAGVNSYEESYYPSVKFELDHEKTNNKHLEYKLENNSNVNFDEASLNLVFYNRGELVCGTKVRLENVMTGRVYYFVYDIPEGLEYTDINTALVLPNSNRYLFKGFYQDYQMYEENLKNLNRSLIHREHVEFVDDREESAKEIEKWKHALKRANKMHTKSEGFKNFLRTILKCLPAIIGYTVGVLIAAFLFGNLLRLMQSSHYPFHLGWSYYLIAAAIGVAIGLFKSYTVSRSEAMENVVTDQKKQDRIKECQDSIKELEDHIADISANKEKYIQEAIEENKKIDEFNAEMEKIKEKNIEMRVQEEKLFEDFKAMYPEYRVIENYDDIDRGLVDAAIEAGAITFDSVELYRRTCREKLDADEKFERQMRAIEEKNRLLAEQNRAIRQNTEQQAWDAMQARAEAAKQARAHDALVLEQIAQNDKLYRQKEYYSNQMSSRIDELRYENYLNSKYL